MSRDASFAVQRRSLIRDVAVVAIALEVAFLVFDFAFNYTAHTSSRPIRRFFNITREDSLSSWFATTQTLLVALTLWLIWAVVRRQEVPVLTRRAWLATALFFSYMAIDDGTKLHERIGSTLGQALERSTLVEQFPSYNWQLFVMPLFAAAGGLLFLFLWRELPDARHRRLVVASFACLAVALALDFVEGLDEEHPWNLHARLDGWLDWDGSARNWFDANGFAAVVHFSKALEETLEMLANTLLWVAFLRYLTERCDEIRLRFR